MREKNATKQSMVSILFIETSTMERDSSHCQIPVQIDVFLVQCCSCPNAQDTNMVLLMLIPLSKLFDLTKLNPNGRHTKASLILFFSPFISCVEYVNKVHSTENGHLTRQKQITHHSTHDSHSQHFLDLEIIG